MIVRLNLTKAHRVLWSREGIFRSVSVWLLLGVLAVGAGWVFSITRHGAGMSPDSAIYVATAESLVSGNGLTVPFGDSPGQPLVHFPPFYPLTLAVMGWMGIDIRLAARLLNAMLLAGTTLLLAATLHLTSRDPRKTILGATLLILSPVVLKIFSMAWSEPLFLFFTLGSFLSLLVGAAKDARILIFTSAILAGLAALTRYAGIAILMAGTGALFIIGSSGLRAKIRDAGSYFVAGFAPLSLWFLRNLYVAGEAVNREVSIHPITRGHLWQAIETFAGWLFLPVEFPGRLKAVFLLVFLSIASWVLFWLFFRPSGRAVEEQVSEIRERTYLKMIAVYVSVYALFLIASITFVDANTPLDDRILSPLFILGFLVVAFMLSSLWERAGLQPWTRRLLAITLVVFAVVALQASARWSLRALNHGLGFNHTQWRNSSLLASLEMFDENATIYSNSPEAIYIHTKRSAYGLPRSINKVNSDENELFMQEMELMRTRLQDHEGLLVYFSGIRSDAWLNAGELVKATGLDLLSAHPEGAIYSSPARRQSDQ